MQRTLADTTENKKRRKITDEYDVPLLSFLYSSRTRSSGRKGGRKGIKGKEKQWLMPIVGHHRRYHPLLHPPCDNSFWLARNWAIARVSRINDCNCIFSRPYYSPFLVSLLLSFSRPCDPGQSGLIIFWIRDPTRLSAP